MRFLHVLIGVVTLGFAPTVSQLTTAVTDTNPVSPASERIQSFKDFEKSLQKEVLNAFKSSSTFSKTSSPQNISEDCFVGIFQLIFGLTRLQEWAVKLLDASGKLNSGILEGSATSLGDYDECFDVNAIRREDTTRYCMVELKLNEVLKTAIKNHQFGNKSSSDLGKSRTFLRFLRHIRIDPEKVVSRIGMCVPSGCTVEDVQEMLNNNILKYGIPGTVKRCEGRKQLTIETHQLVILVLVAFFVILVVTGTLLDVCCFLDSNRGVTGMNSVPKFCYSISSTFSVYQNTKKLLNDPIENELPRCCNGIISLTVIMAIYTHTYAMPHPAHISRYRDAFNLFKFSDDLGFCQVANASAGVEIFFLLAGFTSIYKRWVSSKHSRLKIGGYILRHMVQSFLRMLLAQTLVVCLFMLLPMIGSGPLWKEFVEDTLENCKFNWWQNLFFIQNFQSPYDTCLYNTWILAAMMQIIILTSGIIWITERWPFFGACLYVSTAIVAGIIVAIITAVGDFPPTFAMYFYDYRTSLIMWKYLYVQAYNHIGPYCIGAVLALVLATHQHIKIKMPFLVLCWAVAVATILAIVYGLYDYRDGQPMNRALAVFYSASHRPAWALAFGWIIYSCSRGYGGIIGKILSWNAFIPLEKLSYLVFLLHLPLMYYQAGVQREMMFMGHFEQVMFFLSFTVISYIIAYICYLVFQAPYGNFEKLLFITDRHDQQNVSKSSLGTVGACDYGKERIAVLFSKSNPQPNQVE